MVYSCRGFVSALANFAPHLSYKVYQAGKSRDMDRLVEAIERVAPYFSFIDQVSTAHEPHTGILPQPYGGGDLYIPVAKAAMDMMGLCGGRSRLPLVELTEAERERLEEVLEGMALSTA